MTLANTPQGINTPLSPKESADFEKLEKAIRQWVDSMEAAGRALIEVRDRKLYRGQFTTFEKYVQTKWEFSVRRAYQLCDSVALLDNLRTNGSQTMPTNERQVRELAKVLPEHQAEVWAEVVQTGKPTAEKIAKVVESKLRKPPIIDVEARIESNDDSIEIPQRGKQKLNFTTLQKVWQATKPQHRRRFAKWLRDNRQRYTLEWIELVIEPDQQ